MTKFRKKSEIIEAVKWDGRLETIEENIWLEDSIKEDRVILGMNDLHDKEPILIILYGDDRSGYVVQIGEYIVKRSIDEKYRIETIPSEYFEEKYEVMKCNDNCYTVELELDTDKFNKKLKEAKEQMVSIKESYSDIDTLLVKADKIMKQEDIDKYEKELSEKLNRKVVILPSMLDIVDKWC